MTRGSVVNYVLQTNLEYTTCHHASAHTLQLAINPKLSPTTKPLVLTKQSPHHELPWTSIFGKHIKIQNRRSQIVENSNLRKIFYTVVFEA